MTDVSIRNYTAKDQSFILDSWLKSYKQSSKFARDIPSEVYFKSHSQIILSILSKSYTVIACDHEDQDTIYGYAVFELICDQPVFHYIYLKKSFSGFGIVEKLIENAPFLLNKYVFASHLTPKGLKLIKKYKMTYNPYLI